MFNTLICSNAYLEKIGNKLIVCTALKAVFDRQRSKWYIDLCMQISYELELMNINY
jgi:hypothetical protein